jgi:hypothetical protein
LGHLAQGKIQFGVKFEILLRELDLFTIVLAPKGVEKGIETTQAKTRHPNG